MSRYTGALALALTLVAAGCGSDDKLTNPADSPYQPRIDPADFPTSTVIDNTFLPLIPGTVMVYEGGDEHNEVEVLAETRVVMGIQCVVVHDRVWEDGELTEDTYDWFAQDRYGNVWYMGEDSREMDGDRIASTEGSWEGGVDGGLPGIMMLSHPLAGLWYRTEYYEGEAEDLAQVLSLDETVTVPAGTYDGCILMLELNALEPGVEEHKYYAPGVGVVKEVEVRGGSDAADLIEYRTAE